MDIDMLVKVTSRAWSLSILALMHRGTPGRQALLLSATGAGRTAFSQSFVHLVDMELLEKNPGHGHPLRPEYRLTEEGAKVAKIADRIGQAVPQPSEFAILRRTWMLPILVVSHVPRFFSEMKTELAPITDRALSQSLKQLEAQQWMRRKIDTAIRPPRPLYQAINLGTRISQAVSLEAS